MKDFRKQLEDKRYAYCCQVRELTEKRLTIIYNHKRAGWSPAAIWRKFKASGIFSGIDYVTELYNKTEI